MWNLRHEVTEGLEDPGLPSKGMKLHPGRIYVVSSSESFPPGSALCWFSGQSLSCLKGPRHVKLRLIFV